MGKRTSTAFGSVIGADAKMREIVRLLDGLAATDAPVLIEGEPGTGKEFIATQIHEHSPRRAGPLVVVNCGSVPREVIPLGLFGEVHGTQGNPPGAIGEAHGGTLVIDEIGEMDLALQPSLLHVLDEGVYARMRSSSYEKVDVRVIAATERDLRAEVIKGTFHAGLYERLAAIRVSVPPLRERSGDIALLTNHFLQAFGPDLGVTPDDMARLIRNRWPGNVRELRNVIERACLYPRGNMINLDDALREDARS